jgi:hypothetical protein
LPMFSIIVLLVSAVPSDRVKRNGKHRATADVVHKVDHPGRNGVPENERV